nr:MAG TPA: hypothetical protein [Bacteriophage sp.]
MHIFIRIVYNNPVQQYYFLERFILSVAKLEEDKAFFLYQRY